MSRVFLERFKAGDVLVHGCARGADQMAADLATGIEGVTIEGYPANWATYHRAAGPIRNQQMLDSGVDLVLAFHSDISKSKGTADMLNRARKAGIKTELFTG